MAPTEVPDRFELFNSQSTKQLAVVVKIAGVPGIISSRPLYTRIRYGDPDINYGDPGLVYGGLRRLTTSNGGSVRDIMSLDGSSLTISQRLEPEQGRGAISTLTLSFVDKDQYMTQVVSPGVIVDDILGKEVVVLLGYQEISYPEDYFVVFRGRVTAVEAASGLVTLQLSDPNVGRKQQVFFSGKTKLSASITDVATTIPVIANGDFHKSILGPSGAYDDAIKLYLKIEDEFIEYGPSFSLPAAIFGTNSFSGVLRGQRGTTAVAHPIDAEVQAFVQITDNAMEAALKIMLSGWGGAWVSSVPIEHIVFTSDPVLGDEAGAIILPSQTDAVRDYGLAEGEYITITGATNGANNTTVRVLRFEDLFDEPNRIIYTDGALVHEEDSPGVMAFRSQWDSYPVTCGAKLTPKDVDITTHVNLRNQFLGSADYTLRFFLSSPVSAKTFIESELFLPCSAYSLTKTGRLSVGMTHPPLPDQTLLTLDASNVLDPQSIKPQRAVNNRKFFNEITWEYDPTDDGAFTVTSRYLDTDSLNIIGLTSILPIKSSGARTDLGFVNVVDRSSRFLLSRYKRGATIIDLTVNWEVGCRLESGDVILLRDNGTLQISNFATGERDAGNNLWEVLDRQLNIRNGNTKLKLINGLGYETTDRYGVLAPSSFVGTGSTTTTVIITDSYGSIFPGNEKGKWEDYIGEKVLVHNYDYSISEEVTLNGFDPGNNYAMQVSGLSFTPTAGFIVDIQNYPTSTDPFEADIYKILHAFYDPTVSIVTGVSTTEFTVAPADIGKFIVGFPVRVHNTDFTIDSGDVLITVTAVDVGLNKVTVSTSLGFTPAAGQKVELIGFADSRPGYRYI